MLLHLGGMRGCRPAHQGRQRRSDNGGGDGSELNSAAANHMRISTGVNGTSGIAKKNNGQTSGHSDAADDAP
jgi:hypothetical protein